MTAADSQQNNPWRVGSVRERSDVSGTRAPVAGASDPVRIAARLTNPPDVATRYDNWGVYVVGTRRPIHPVLCRRHRPAVCRGIDTCLQPHSPVPHRTGLTPLHFTRRASVDWAAASTCFSLHRSRRAVPRRGGANDSTQSAE